MKLGRQLIYRKVESDQKSVCNMLVSLLFDLTMERLTLEKRLVVESMFIRLGNMSSRMIYNFANGFYLVGIIVTQQKRVRAWKAGAGNGIRGGERTDPTLDHADLTNYILPFIETINVLRKSLYDSESESFNEGPLCKEVMRASLFWNLQFVLYFAEDVRKLAHSGWSRFMDEFERGLLLWQQGWLAAHPDVAKVLLDVMSFD
jgi:hypothetical protein